VLVDHVAAAAAWIPAVSPLSLVEVEGAEPHSLPLLAVVAAVVGELVVVVVACLRRVVVVVWIGWPGPVAMAHEAESAGVPASHSDP